MKPVVLCFFVLCALRLPAQDAGDMDVLLETPAVSGAQAARFVLGAAGLLPAGLSGPAAEEAAWSAARERGWASGGGSAALSLKETAFLVMGAFNLKGGLMYTLFPGPRYAYRELLHLRIIQGRADGNFTVSGERLLEIIGRVLRHTGDDAAGAFDAGEAEAETPVVEAPNEEASDGGIPAGEGLSGGPEELLPYKGEFDVE